jgi:hypothetical protein
MHPGEKAGQVPGAGLGLDDTSTRLVYTDVGTMAFGTVALACSLLTGYSTWQMKPLR